MPTLRAILLVAAPVLVLSACHAAPIGRVAAPSAPRVMASGDLYPLKAGLSWTYELEQSQDGAPAITRSMSIQITSVTRLSDGDTEGVLERTYGNFRPPSTRVRKNAERVSLSRLSDPPDGPSVTILRFPLEVGSSWPGRPFGGGNTETICPRGVEHVAVPLGEFEAERLDHIVQYANGASDTLNYWYAPGVGVVKMIERITLWKGSDAIHFTSVGSLKSRESGAVSLRKGPAIPDSQGAQGVFRLVPIP